MIKLKMHLNLLLIFIALQNGKSCKNEYSQE